MGWVQGKGAGPPCSGSEEGESTEQHTQQVALSSGVCYLSSLDPALVDTEINKVGHTEPCTGTAGTY